MVHDGQRAFVVDPGDAAPVMAALDAGPLTLAGILVTHHHADHVGGVDALRSRLQGPVYGPGAERIPQPFEPLAEGDTIELLGLRMQVIDVPGHTAGHIAYYAESGGAGAADTPWLFCGDTLFSAGCGRLFEGTPQQMHTSLQRLSGLPGRTQVMCTHEYTLANLRFAEAVEPGNAAIREYREWCTAQRAASQPTLPSTIERERHVNPFLRCSEPAVIDAGRREGANGSSPVAVFTALREWKNHFR